MLVVDTHTLLSRCRRLSERPSLDETDLRDVLSTVRLSDVALEELELPDSSQPYGRNVILRSPSLEVMVATWTAGISCAPHDHGGSVGAVLVLRGCGQHSLFRIRDGGLELASQHVVTGGEILNVSSELVHAMVDRDSQGPLMTLHLYTTAIDDMVVYDVPGRRTLVVDGSCGAWVPSEPGDLIRREVAGFLEPDAVRSL